MKSRLIIVTLFACALCAWAESGSTLTVDCGSWVELTATPFEDYHFVSWNDGNTDSLRRVQVDADANYIAYFAANCEEYANWPVVALYDWLIMLNVNAVNELGYHPSPERTTWYRIVGEPDDLHNAFPQDDERVCSGFYLTIDRSLNGTGDYYAVVDASDAGGHLCDGLMRTIIVHYAGAPGQQRLTLTPTAVRAGQQMQLKGLVPGEKTLVTIYSATGQLISSQTTTGDTTLLLEAAPVLGCYQVCVSGESLHETLRYIVTTY